MGKALSIITGIALQLALVLIGHIYFSNNPKEVAIVVDSSYGLNTYRKAITDVIDDLNEGKYTIFHYGTDKTYLGEDVNLDSIFRVNFGKLDESKLEMLYPQRNYDERYLVSFTDVNKLNNWIVINVND